MNEYGFDPKFILNSIIKIYIAFQEYKEFLIFIVSDERSFKIENFEYVIKMKDKEKISLDYENYNQFISFVCNLKEIDKEIKLKQVSVCILKYLLDKL